MTPRELIRSTSASFRTAGIPDPDHDAAMLLSHLTGRNALELRLDSETGLDPAVLSAYRELAQKRLDRVPLQYLLGETSFFGRMFSVDPRVLIPRPETELLCEWALEILKDVPSPRILDLCCGSGCIGLTLKAERPDASVTLSDFSPDALDVASMNAARFSLNAAFRCSDLLNGFRGISFDLIVSNPPYIPSADCVSLQPEVMKEPVLALDGGPDGCALYRRIIRSACSVLAPGGRLLMEFGVHEAAVLASLFHTAHFKDIEIRRDLAGIERMIQGVLP